MADITLQATNNLNIKDGADSVAVLNKSITVIDEKEYTRNKEVLNPSTFPVAVTLDYAAITTPKYIKLVSDGLIDITIGVETITNVNFFELQGVIPVITVINNSSTDKVVVDYVVLGS